jgi:glycine hydroxymethyltransferase
MPSLSRRKWVPESCENYVQGLAKFASEQSAEKVANEISRLTAFNRRIYERECFNLNPAGNVMNPRAEAYLAENLGSRPSLGYPGDKYEMGLEAVEQIEVITAELCAETFQAKYAEIRVASGAMAISMPSWQPASRVIKSSRHLHALAAMLPITWQALPGLRSGNS